MLNTRTSMLLWVVNESQHIPNVCAVREAAAHSVLLVFLDRGHSTQGATVPGHRGSPAVNFSQISLRSSFLFEVLKEPS